jgi:hypothetical protein
MKGKREEAELIVRLDQHDGCAYICVSVWPALYRKMCRLYGPSLDGSNPEHTARWKLPLKAVSFRRIQPSEKPRRMPTFAFKRREKQQFETIPPES